MGSTGLEPRTRLEPFDDHDTVLDALMVTDPAGMAVARAAQQSFERAAGLG